MVDFALGAPVPGDLDVAWDHGVPRGTRDPGPVVQVHSFDEHTVILRQSKSTSFEAPFLYLLMRTGPTAIPRLLLRTVRQRLAGRWRSWLAD